jgi:hypothetical protein
LENVRDTNSIGGVDLRTVLHCQLFCYGTLLFCIFFWIASLFFLVKHAFSTSLLSKKANHQKKKDEAQFLINSMLKEKTKKITYKKGPKKITRVNLD